MSMVTVDKLALVWASISALCRPFTDEQWDTPTECPGWTVRDQISHLIGTERMLGGKPESAHRAPEVPYVHNPIGRMNEDHVDERRGRAGASVLAEFDETVAERLLQLRRSTADDFATPAQTPTGPGTVADFLHIRVMDTWVHEQDIRRAVGLPGHLGGPVAEHAVDRFLTGLLMVVGKRAGATTGQSLRLVLTGPVHRDVSVVVGERAQLAPEPVAAPTATVRMGSGCYVTVSTGRQPGTPYVDDGRIVVSGDAALGRAFVAGMNIMI
jgi:uncharacterized protein (TIGR03083 family)